MPAPGQRFPIQAGMTGIKRQHLMRVLSDQDIFNIELVCGVLTSFHYPEISKIMALGSHLDEYHCRCCIADGARGCGSNGL